MRFAFTVLIILFGVHAGMAHPLHLSITNIDFKGDSAFITIRLFQDDFSTAIINAYIAADSTVKEDPLEHAFAKKYIQNHFILSIDNLNLPLKFLNSHNDELSVWYYFSTKCPGDEKHIQLENTLMNEFFKDQKNMVITGSDGIEKGYEFNTVTIRQKLEFTHKKQDHE